MTEASTLDLALAQRVASLLIDARQTVAVAESSSGGLISAALLSLPGASAYFLGGGIVYTATARESLLGITPAMMAHTRSATPEAARLYAATVRELHNADWGLAESGATGPSGNRYGDAAGHCCLAVAGPVMREKVLETGSPNRMANMTTFANAAMALLEQALQKSS